MIRGPLKRTKEAFTGNRTCDQCGKRPAVKAIWAGSKRWELCRQCARGWSDDDNDD